MVNSRFPHALRRTALASALGLCFATGALAQSNSAGAVFGQASAGDKVVIENPATGVRREVTVGSDGSYRAGALPVGTYRVTLQRADGSSDVRENVGVSVGTGTPVSFSDATTLDAVEVTGAMVNPIDVSSVESATILTEAQIDRLPVNRNVTAVALLAPGTVRGDNRFGNLASFGGASVAENAYYINGFNVTNITKGLAFNSVPFEAIAEQQIKTGGYGAEFGRSLGGVVNVITKRGTNEWKSGVSAYWSPDSLAKGKALAWDPERDGSYTIVDSGTKTDGLKYNIWSGGALVQDRLFVFGLFQGQQEDKVENFQGYSERSDVDTPQGLVKIDWNITDNHLLELTAFRDKSETEGAKFNRATGDQGVGGGSKTGTFLDERGGDNVIARWTGYLTDSFTLSALYGKGEYSRFSTDSNGQGCPYIQDRRSVANPVQGCWVNTSRGVPGAGDERTAYRMDGEWALGNHTVRFGLDNEEYETVDGSSYSGGMRFRYINATPGAKLANGAFVPTGVTQIVTKRVFDNGGTFTTKNNAWYVEDNWQVSDNLLVNLGVRNEGFENLNAFDQTFVDIQDTWAPRLGFSWDVNGDSSLKVFGNAGRYYIPVYANTNVRLAGRELDYTEYYTFSGIDPVTGAPTGIQQLGPRLVTSNGEPKDPRSVVDNNLDPMYQNEYILGVQHMITEDWLVGVRAIRRDLQSGMDDTCSGDKPYEWALANGYTQSQAEAIFDAIDHCFLTNPGKPLSANVDLDGNGTLSVVNIPAEALGMPEAVRKYRAIEVFFEHAWNGKWFLQGSYTWAKSYGNTEGYVKSDNGQTDAGITQDFDFPGLMDGAYGYLPNDRRHSVKVFGAYQFAEEWRVGANLLLQSGRPINCFGVYPSNGPDHTAPFYGAASFYCGTDAANAYPSTLKPRGTSGRVPGVATLDLQLAYAPAWNEDLSFRMDVTNVTNSKDYYRVQDVFEDSGRAKVYDYKHPLGFVDARTVQFSVEYKF